MAEQRLIDAEEAKRIARDELTNPYEVISACAVIDKTPTVNPCRWINVDERLPEDGEGFQLVVVSGTVGKTLLKNAIEHAEYSSKDGWILEMWPLEKNLKVTHWMRLPKPPKEALRNADNHG